MNYTTMFPDALTAHACVEAIAHMCQQQGGKAVVVCNRLQMPKGRLHYLYLDEGIEFTFVPDKSVDGS